VKSFTLKDIALAGLIAAVYAVLGLAFFPISFGVYQVRVAEALTVLPFLSRAAIPGLFIGCMLANVYGGQGWQDIVFGSLITLAAAVLTQMTARLTRTALSNVLSSVPAILLWAGGLVLLSKGSIHTPVIGLAVISVAILALATRPKSRPQPSATAVYVLRLASAATLVGAVVLVPAPQDWMTYVVGVIALVGAWLMTWYLTLIRQRGENPNTLIAPLPPVILNAFGVALYLAPILEFNYWFVVQMIGIGQLVACYVLGLPLLRLLQNRKSLFT